MAHWAFDETGGSVARDASGNGHDGTLSAGASFADGILGRALALDGVSGVVEIEDPGAGSDFDLTSALTIAAWIRPGAGGQGMLLSKDNVYELRVDPSRSGRWDLRLDNADGVPAADTGLRLESWQHAAVTWDGQRVRYYRDGQPAGGFAFRDPLRANDRDLGIGARPNRILALHARLDDLRLYSRALSAGEIRELHALGGPADDDPPVLSRAAPTGKLAAGSTEAEVSLETDEEATCRYDEVAGTRYEDMPFLFETTEATRHRTRVTGLEDGRTYALFVRCVDVRGNASAGITPEGDFPILFSVDRPGFDPKDLEPLLFYVESTFFEDAENRARSIATCRTRECFEAPDRSRIELQYCDTVIDQRSVAGARGTAPDGCVRRWEDQSTYQSLREVRFRGELFSGRDFGQDDHEKPVFVPNCLNGRPCARGQEAAAAPIFRQNTSFEIEFADSFGSEETPPQGFPNTTGLAGPFSIFHLVKPVAQEENWFYFGCFVKGLRHNVHDDSLYFHGERGRKITPPNAIELDRWQLLEIHRDERNAIRVVTNGEDVTHERPHVTDERWCYTDVMSRSKGLQPMLGELAASVVYDRLLSEEERRDVRDYFDQVYGYLGAAASPPDTRPPSKPRNVVATAGGPDRIRLVWDPSVDDVEVTGYQVFRDGFYVTTAAAASFTDSGRVSGQTYVYTLRARDGAGNTSGLSAPVSASIDPPSQGPVPRRGYRARPCGFDMDDDFVYGEPEDCNVGDGKTRDPDGDGVAEDLIYVDCDRGSDGRGDGSANRPFLTLDHAVAVADGPADGAEDIIAFRGTCTPEDLMIDLSGVRGVKVRPRSGSEERNFQYPRDPAMLIGWDFDDDGVYPPLDPDDVAVVAGGEPDCLVRPFHSSTTPYRFFEMAHFEARSYGTCNTTLDSDGQVVSEKKGGFYRFRGGVGRTYTHHYFHDLEISGTNRGRLGSSERNVWNMFVGSSVVQWLAVENVFMPDSAGYVMRGSAADDPGLADSGPIRFERSTHTCLSGVEPGESNTQCSGFKLWNHVSRIEVIDSLFDFQPEAFEVVPENANTFTTVAQCSQDVVYRNNEVVDYRVAFNVGFDESACKVAPRPVKDVTIDQNRITVSFPWPNAGCFFVNSCLDSRRTVEDVTFTNNFCSMSHPTRQMIFVECAPEEGPNPGGIVIAGNTFHAAADVDAVVRQGANARFSCTPFVEDDIFLWNNVFVAGPRSERLALTCELPGFSAGSNTYSAGGQFRRGEARFATLAEWQAATGQDAGSRECTPELADASKHDLHLAPTDTCARDQGVDLSSTIPLLARDVDGDARPLGVATDIGADEADPR